MLQACEDFNLDSWISSFDSWISSFDRSLVYLTSILKFDQETWLSQIWGFYDVLVYMNSLENRSGNTTRILDSWISTFG